MPVRHTCECEIGEWLLRPNRNTSSSATPLSTDRIAAVSKNSLLRLENEFRAKFIHHPEVSWPGTEVNHRAGKKILRTHDE